MSEETYGFQAEIEASFLGILLHFGTGLTTVRSWLRPDHFLEPVHRGIFETITQVFDRSHSSKTPFVKKALSQDLRDAIAQRTGRPADDYLAHLTASVPYGLKDIERAATNVIEQAARINLADRCEEWADALRNPLAIPADVARLIGTGAEEIITDLRGSGGRRTRASIGDVGVDVLRNIAASMEGKGPKGIPWGPLSDIDRVTGGMQRGDLIILGGRPSMGKTTVLASVALGAARKGHGVGILSLEMAKDAIALRCLSALTSADRLRGAIPYNDAHNGRLDAGQFAHLQDTNERLRDYPIEIDDGTASAVSVRAKIEGMLERFHRAGQPPLELLIIDHLGFVQPSAVYGGNRNNEIGEITRTFKTYAKEYQLAVLLISQLSREAAKRDNKRPQLSDLRDSGNIEQDADLVAFLHRDAYYLERERELEGDRELERLERLDACRNSLEFIIAKNRMGPTTTVPLWCDMALSDVRNGDWQRS